MTTIRSNNDHGDGIEDEPSHTASCIKFSLISSNENERYTEFHPIYTHQIFDEDQMSHFEPVSSAASSSSSSSSLASMPQCRYQKQQQKDEKDTLSQKRTNETLKTHELDVRIILSPSFYAAYVFKCEII